MDENLIKIRKNLIISSFVMFLIIYADISIPDKINLFGIGITVNNPEYINIFLFVISIYFLIRFFHSLENNNFKFKESFLRSSLNVMGKHITPIYQKYEGEYYENYHYSDDEDSINTIDNILHRKKYTIELPQNLGSEIDRRSFFNYTWTWNRILDFEDSAAHAVSAKTIIIPKLTICWGYIVAIVKTLLSKNTFEFHLPLFFGVIMLCIFAYHKLLLRFDFFQNIFL